MRHQKRSLVTRNSKRRGSSLAEVVVAIAILALLMISVLEVMSLSLLVNHAAAARTEMTYKCQEVVENLRLIYNQTKNPSPEATLSGKRFAAAAGLPATMAVTVSPQLLPYIPSDTGYDYWGPAGANIVNDNFNPGSAAPYRFSYVVEDPGAAFDYWRVTVTAIAVGYPSTDVNVQAQSAPATSSRRYLGYQAQNKRVDYVAHVKR